MAEALPSRRAVAAAAALVTVLGVVAGLPVAAGGKYVAVDAPAEATAGDAVDVTVSVSVPDVPGRNGSASGTVSLSVDGHEVGSRSVTASDGETVTVTFTHAFEEAGRHDVSGRAEATVAGTTYSDSDSTTVDVVAPEDGSEDSDGSDGSDGSGTPDGGDDTPDGSDGSDGEDARDDDASDGDTGENEQSDRDDASGGDGDRSGETDGDEDGNGAGRAGDGGGDGRDGSDLGAGTASHRPSVTVAPLGALDLSALPGVARTRALSVPVALDVTGDGRVTLADAIAALTRA